LGDGFFFEERHGSDRNLHWHYIQHFTTGAIWHDGEGIALENYELQPSSPSDSDNQFSLSSGEMHDEDISNQMLATDTGSYYILRRSGVSGIWTWTTETIPLIASGTYMDYNEYTGGSWTTTEASNGDYINMYVVSIPLYGGSTTNMVIMGQNVHSTLLKAQAETASELSFGDFIFQEIVFAYKITFKTSASYGTTGKVRIEAVDDTRMSTSRSIISSSPSSNHNSLAGLQGGGAGEYFHLTTSEHSGLTTGINADVYHSHSYSGAGASYHSGLSGLDNMVDHSGYPLLDGTRDVTGSQGFSVDDLKHYYGAANDASITYDGTNMVYDSQEVGGGDHVFEGGKLIANGTYMPVQRFSSGTLPLYTTFCVTPAGLPTGSVVRLTIDLVNNGGVTCGLYYDTTQITTSTTSFTLLYTTVATVTNFILKPLSGAITDSSFFGNLKMEILNHT